MKKLDRILKVFDKAQRELDIFIDKTRTHQMVIEDEQSKLQLQYDDLTQDITKAVSVSNNIKNLLGDM